jgi:FkbM family methyltransferase
MVKKIAGYFLGRVELQNFFEKLHKLSLYGMQYGSGVFVKDSGEENAAQYVREKIKKSSDDIILFDVGANKGEYAITLQKIFSGLPHKTYCFEPSQEIFEFMKKNVAQHVEIIPFQIGLGDVAQKFTLHKRAAFSGMNSIIERKMDHYNIQFDIKEEITVETVDEFCLKHRIGKIDFMKMDVEGYEYKCLLGAKRMIDEGNIRFIQFEFGSTSLDARVFFQDFWYLLKDKYHFFRIVKNGLVPIKKYNERLEIFRTSNFLLEKKS